jgi:mannosylglycerate hydrolase
MGTRELTGFIITAGHLDIEWYQPLRSYRFWTIETFADLKKACARKDFTCYVLDGQVFPLEEYLEIIPEDEGVLRKLIQEGKLSIGPFYTQFDEWLPSAESMIRNCLYGKRRAEAFGGYMRAGYLPDNFGHPLQLPQILQGFGINSLLFMRGLPEIPGGHPDEFMYRGLDGSEVLVSHFRESYSGAFDLFNKKIDPIQPRIVPYYDNYLSFEWHKELADHDDPQRIAQSMISNVERIKDRYPSKIIPLIAGFDHLPPQINIGDSVKIANEIQKDIKFIMGSAEDYIDLVYSRISNPIVYDKELLGSRYQYVLLGALSTRCYLKQKNFACEALMERYVEPLDALASCYGYPDKGRLLDEAWKYIMINSAHDSIHGSSVDEVHTEMEFRNAAVQQIAAGLIHDILSYWGRHIDHWWKNLDKDNSRTKLELAFPQAREMDLEFSPKGILTYTPVKSNFPQLGELWLPVGDLPVVIRTADGRELAAQVLPRETIPLNGQGQPRHEPFPSLVYRKVLFLEKFNSAEVCVHGVVFREGESRVSTLQAGDTFIENEYIRVETDGALLRLYDKRQNHWYYNLNLLEEEADAGDAWDFSPPWIPGELVRSTEAEFTGTLIENGPVRAALELRGNLKVPAELIGDKRSPRRVDLPIVFTIQVYTGIPRVDVVLKIDNTARDHRIRLRFIPNLKTDFVRSQGHLAILDRPVERQKEIEPWYQPVTQLLPFREWLALEDDKRGLGIVLKGIYDYEAAVNPLTGCPELAMTLIRGIALMGRLNTMQRKGGASSSVAVPGAQCLGIQQFEWSYIPYEAMEDEKAPFLPLAQSFLYPLVSHAIRSIQEDTTIPTEPGFDWDASNIQFSAFKRCLDRDGYILRIYENQGKFTELRLALPGFTQVFKSNMNEQTGEVLKITNGTVTVKVRAYEAVTIKLVR